MSIETILCIATPVVIIIALILSQIYIDAIPNKTFTGIYKGYKTTDNGNQIRILFIGNDTIKNVVISENGMQRLDSVLGKDIELTLSESPGHYFYLEGFRIMSN